MNGRVDEYVEKKRDISLPVLERHVSLPSYFVLQ